MMTQIERIIYDEGYDNGYDNGYEHAPQLEMKKRIIYAIQMGKALGNDKLSVLKQLPEIFSISEKEAISHTAILLLFTIHSSRQAPATPRVFPEVLSSEILFCHLYLKNNDLSLLLR